MKKKLLMFLLCFSVIFSIAGCFKKDNDDDNYYNNSSNTETNTDSNNQSGSGGGGRFPGIADKENMLN